MDPFPTTTETTTSHKHLLALTVDATEQCNLGCTYCYRGPAGARTVDAQAVLKTIGRLWSSIVEHGGVTVSFMGGEPLIAIDKIFCLVEEMKTMTQRDGLRFGWSLTSNLTLLTPEKLERVLNAGGSIHCSIDGSPSSQDQNRPYLNGRGSSADVARHIANLHASGRQLGARMTVTPKTVGRMAEDVAYVHELGFASIAVFPAFNGQDWQPEHLDLVREQACQLAQMRLTQLSGLKRLHPLDGYAHLPFNRQIPSLAHCGACHNYLSIDVRGSLFPCHRFTGRQSYEISDLDGDGDGSWSQMRAMLQREPSESCRSCPLLGACQGGCWVENLDATGKVSSPGETACAYNRALSQGIADSGLQTQMHKDEDSCCWGCDNCFICVTCAGCDACDNCNTCFTEVCMMGNVGICTH